jgi:hypothetical protein
MILIIVLLKVRVKKGLGLFTIAKSIAIKNAIQRIESGQHFVTDIELKAFAELSQERIISYLTALSNPKYYIP